METLTDFDRLKKLQQSHQEAKAHWFGLLHADRNEPQYFAQLEAASLAYTVAAEAHIAFWDPTETGAG